MTEVKRPPVVLTQIEEALEERQRQDRRQVDKGLPENVSEERRKGDRRASQTSAK